MSFEAMAWAVKIELPVKQKITLLLLANRADPDTAMCYPSIPKLALDCGMSVTSVKEAIRSLKEAGLVIVHERRMDGVSLSNVYELPLGEIPTPPAQYAPPPGAIRPTPRRNTPPKLSEETITETDDGQIEQLTLLSEEPTEAPRPTFAEQFETFWKAYPKKAGKDAARRAFEKALRRVDAATLITAAKRYAASESVARGFVKHAQGWLNDGRFADEDVSAPQPDLRPGFWEERVR